MSSLREIIEKILRENPNQSRDELFDVVMTKVRKKGFHTKEELTAIEEELTERLSNY